MNSLQSEVKDFIAGIPVIDVDTHITEPHDLWTSRAPKHLKGRVPRVAPVNGVPMWVIDDIPFGFGVQTFSTVLKDKTKTTGMGFEGFQITDIHPAAYDVKARLETMDESGIWAQILYANILQFGGKNGAKIDPQVRLASTQIYNDAMAEIQEASGQRIFPMALLPWWDAKLSVAEAKRSRKMGLRGLNINSDPQGHGVPDLSDRSWDPLWEVCADLNLPINFHIGSSEQTVMWYNNQSWPSLAPDIKLAICSSILYLDNARVMANILLSGLLDRFPTLHFVSVESGIGWIPFLLEALDYQMTENAPESRRTMKLAPSEYFKRNMHACFWFERRDIGNTLAQVGVDNVMFETDFPHPTCLYPDPLAHGAATLAKLTKEDRYKILSGNAAKLYALPVP
jgi:uncharacterized protein